MSFVSFLLALIVISSMLSVTAPPQKAYAATFFTNEIMPQQADAFMTQKDGYYYLIYSDYDKNIYINKSTSLAGINTGTKVKVWTAPSSGADSMHNWSPFLYYINNKWYIYYSADSGSITDHRIFVLESTTTDAQGTYNSKGQIGDSWDSGNTRCALSLAPFVYSSSTYAVLSRCAVPIAGSSPPAVNSRVSIVTMNDPWTVSSDETFISTPTYPWEGSVDEGPVPLMHNGDLFILHSANDTHIDYKMGLVKYTGGSLMSAGSWTKTSTPVFDSYSGLDGDSKSPGAPSLVKSPDGTEDWIVYHGCSGYSNCNGYNEQSIRAQKFTWNVDGTPNFGHPIPVGISTLVPSGENGNTAPTSSIFNDTVTGTSTNQINYVNSGDWSYATGAPENYQGDEHFSNITNAYAEIKFNGTQIKVYGSLDPSHGNAAYSIDGGTEKTVILWNTARRWNVLDYTSPVLSNGPHTLKVRVTGTKEALSTGYYVTLDRVEVSSPAIVTTGTTTMNDSINGQYTGTHWNTGTSVSTYFNDEHFNNTTNEYVLIPFFGTQIQYYGSKDPTHGIGSFSIDGGAESDVDFYAASRQWFQSVYSSPILNPGYHTLKVRVKGTKNASANDYYITSDAVVITGGITSINDTISGSSTDEYQYSGNWTYGITCGCHLNDEHFDNTTNDYALISFYGTQIEYYGSKYSDHGIGAFSVDGGSETNVDFYASTRLWNQSIYLSPVLPLGYHTLKVRVTGTKNSSASNNYITSDRVDIH